MRKKDEIEKLKPKIVKVLKRNGVKRAGIFGSYARGEQTENSDVDILVEFGKDVSLFNFVSVKLEVENLIGKKIDLVEYRTVKSKIKKNVLNEEVK